MFDRALDQIRGTDLTTDSGRALVEERYWSLRRQTPIVYLLGIVNLAAMERVATGNLSIGLNVPTFVAVCALVRMWQWHLIGRGRTPNHTVMRERLQQTFRFAALVCVVVSARCIYLLQVGDAFSHMAVMLFGGLTAIGVAYGLTALPAAGWIPLLLIIVPISGLALRSDEPGFRGAAFGLVAVAVLTMQLLGAHSRHFRTVIRSRSVIAREQELVEHARQEAVMAATTDFLTGLPNRRAFFAALDQEIGQNSESFAVAILDLDRFKTVNDTFGHAVGDQLLKEVARRLMNAIDSRGIVARLGGDEFGVLRPDICRADEAKKFGSRLLESVNGRACLGEREFSIAASCGIGLSRIGNPSPSRLMADADLALYQAKDNPGGGFAVFDLAMEAPRHRRAQIELALQQPNICNHLGVVFQPIFDLKTGKILAAEALARWNDPEIGAVSPSEFVPIAEQINRIDEINCHLMRMAFGAANAWPSEVKLSFNLSAIQLCSAGSAKLMLDALQRAGLAAERLQAEVTETSLLVDFENARSNLTALKNAGATIVLDDFGAGFASLGYLREISFDQIKLDGGLVTAAEHSSDGKRLLRAVVGLCEILGVSTVAEHVESKELLDLVVELGCSAGQGFWLERPLAAGELLSLLVGRIIPLRARGSRRAA